MLISRRRRLGTTGGGGSVADHLAYTTAPGLSGASPYTLSPQPVVAAKKADGTTDTTKTGTVVFSLVVLTGTPLLGGTTSVALSSGVATATNLSVTGAGTWQLQASLAGLASATSSTGTTTAGASSTVYASDAFTDTDGVALTSHTPVAVGAGPAGTGWTAVNGASPSAQILGGRSINNTSTAGLHRLALNASGTTPADHSVTADFVFFTNLGDSSITGIIARMTGGASGVGGYYLTYTQSLSPFWQLLRIDDAFASSQLGANVPYAFPTSGTTVAVEIRCVAGSVKVYVGGSLILDQTDASPLTGTKAGRADNNATAPTATTGVHVDNLVIKDPS